jgi:hypothetical protein
LETGLEEDIHPGFFFKAGVLGARTYQKLGKTLMPPTVLKKNWFTENNSGLNVFSLFKNPPACSLRSRRVHGKELTFIICNRNQNRILPRKCTEQEHV